MHHPTTGTLLYLSTAEVAACGVGAVAIADRIEQVLAGSRAGAAWNAPKTSVLPGDGRLFQAMVAAADQPPFAAVKSVALAPGNAARGLAHIHALITLFDAATGVPLAVMDGAGITATRTAAMSLVAARRLARSDSSVLGVLGVGVQARSHLAALAAEFPLRRVLAIGRSAEGLAAFLDHARSTGLQAEAASGPAQLLEQSDLVVSSVPAEPGLQPLLDASRLAPGAFAAMCDTGRSWQRASYTAFDRLFIDDERQEHDAAAHGIGMVEPGSASGDLVALVTGAASGRGDRRQRTAFVFRGLAAGDLAAASLVYQAAGGAGLGSRLPL